MLVHVLYMYMYCKAVMSYLRTENLFVLKCIYMYTCSVGLVNYNLKSKHCDF